MMADMIYQKVKRYIIQYQMIGQGDFVAAGISGGADSVCLLYLLHRLREESPYRLAVVHVNHMAREAAGEDAAFVENLCKKLDVPFHLREVDMYGYAGLHKLSPEEAGRILRYQVFEEVADKQGSAGGKIAVAHNANDRAETMLFHMFRGSGLDGLSSIRPVRDSVIRPVLCLTREEIEDYLDRQGILYCRDSTNEEDVYARNRIRHHILPYAEKEICARTVPHMNDLADILMETQEYLDRETKRLFELYADVPAADFAVGAAGESERTEDCAEETERMEDCAEETGQSGKDSEKGHRTGAVVERTDTCNCLKIHVKALLAEEPVMVKRVLLYALERMTPHRKDITGQHIINLTELMHKDGSKELSLPYGIKACKEYGILILQKTGAGTGTGEEQSGEEFRERENYRIEPPAEIDVPGMGCFSFTRIMKDASWEEHVLSIKEQNNPQNRYTKWFDYDKITTSLLLRTRRAGDYLTIDQALHTKSLKQYMINEKIPKVQRDGMYILADGQHVLWIPGYRISQYYKVDENTKCILQVQLRGGYHGGTN